MLELMTLVGIAYFFKREWAPVRRGSLFCYLVMSGLSSVFLVSSFLVVSWSDLLLVIGVLIKMGVAPFLGWVYRVVEGGK